VPRYFFAIRGTDREVDDPHGTILPNDSAALSYAERMITQLREKSEGYDDPGMIMFVRNDVHKLVWSIPFLPGYA
jgi:Domain of unknown function (DUF6894)